MGRRERERERQRGGDPPQFSLNEKKGGRWKRESRGGKKRMGWTKGK